MATELIALEHDKSDDPRFAVCYARGSSFRREGKNFLRVEKGMRTRVSRVLCITTHFEKRCEICPNYDTKLVLRASESE